MTQHILQPYRKFELAFINQLTYQNSYYLVSQCYRRANSEVDHTKTPVLFSPYKKSEEAAKHFEQLQTKQDRCRSFVDVRKEKVITRLTEVCYGLTDKVPYIALVANSQHVNNFLQHYYYEKYRAWIRKNKSDWNIQEHNAIEPRFITIMGEPMVKLIWGKKSAIVSLEELEGI